MRNLKNLENQDNKYALIKAGIVPTIIAILFISSFVWYFFYSGYSGGGECILDSMTGDCYFN